MTRVDELTGPPVEGELYLVPCFVEKIKNEPDYAVDATGELSLINNDVEQIYPIINHLHTDRENGQELPHYHSEYRFYSIKAHERIGSGGFNVRIYPNDDTFKNLKIEYRAMRCGSTVQRNTTPVDMIRQSKLKHKCMHKGKCPHRGYDLSQVEPIHGVITCPLHGLQFHADSKQLVFEPRLRWLLDRIDGTRYAIEQEDDWVNEDRARPGELRNQLNHYMEELQKSYPDEFVALIKRDRKEREARAARAMEEKKRLLEPTNFQ